MSEIDTGIWYQSSVSGLWYQDANAAGGICAIRVNGVTAYLPDTRPDLKAELINNFVGNSYRDEFDKPVISLEMAEIIINTIMGEK